MEEPKYQIVLPTEEVYKRDLEYIKNEIIAKQRNGLYCKVSRILKSITVVNISKENYIKYWTKIYEKDKKHPERTEKIRETIIDKLENDLTPLETVIKIQQNSTDPIEETKRLIGEITKLKVNKEEDEDSE